MKKALLLLALTVLGLITIPPTAQAQDAPKKLILLEHFTNTRCGICASRNPTFHENITEVYEDVDVLHISYHPSVPYSSCFLYQQNPQEQEARRNYYNGVSGTPRMFIQGERVTGSSELLPVSRLEEQLGQFSFIDLNVEEEIIGNSRQATITINALGDLPAGDWRIRSMIVEKRVNYDAPNGEDVHYNVFRELLTDSWDGESVDLVGGESASFNYSFEIDNDWVANEIYVLSFLQNDETQEVLQSASSWGKAFVTSVEELANNTQITLYPNPVKNQLQVAFSNTQIAKNQNVTLQIIDVTGQIVMTQKVNNNQSDFSLDISQLSNGLYHLQIKTPNQAVEMTRKFLKID